MKRLLELQDASPLIERAQELIAAAEPIDASQARGERIRRDLDRSARSTATIWVRLPALGIAGLVLLFGASSFAALWLWTTATETDPSSAAPERDVARGSRGEPGTVQLQPAAPSTTQPWATKPSNRQVSPQPSAAGFKARSSRPQRSSQRVTRASGSSREPAAPAELVTPLVTYPDAEQSSRPAAAAPVTGASSSPREPVELETPVTYPDAEQSSRPAEAAPPVATSAATTTNSELVVRAVRALRREGDPALAARLLDTYRARRALGSGPLGEEVLALQIEAAVANADPRATRFAREYLTRYPAGRYADIARRALSELSP
jgi:hypothetical protein